MMHSNGAGRLSMTEQLAFSCAACDDNLHYKTLIDAFRTRRGLRLPVWTHGLLDIARPKQSGEVHEQGLVGQLLSHTDSVGPRQQVVTHGPHGNVDTHRLPAP